MELRQYVSVCLTSTRVAPVARKLETRIISPMAAMLAPRITKASCVGSTLTTTLSYKVTTFS